MFLCFLYDFTRFLLKRLYKALLGASWGPLGGSFGRKSRLEVVPEAIKPLLYYFSSLPRLSCTTFFRPRSPLGSLPRASGTLSGAAFGTERAPRAPGSLEIAPGRSPNSLHERICGIVPWLASACPDTLRLRISASPSPVGQLMSCGGMPGGP